MRDLIIGLVEKADRALALSVGVIDGETLQLISRARDVMRTRLAYPESMIVAGLVGGTGSGKSSLINAVAGEEVSESGGIRPTTSEPMALVPRGRGGEMEGYLDLLKVRHRVKGEVPEWLCLIDLPDTDSVVLDHRYQVDHLLPALDVVIWVFDTEKYRDASIHQRIKSLIDYSAQFLFVLNQIDRLPRSALAQVESDLRSTIVADGVERPRLCLTAAHPASGPPIGVDALVEELDRARTGDPHVFRKLVVDLVETSAALLSVTEGGRGLDFETRWAATLSKTQDGLHRGSTSEATHAIISLVDELTAELHGETASGLRSIAVRAPAILEELFGGPSLAATSSQLDSRIGEPIRGVLRARAAAHAAVADFCLSVGELDRRFGS